MNHVIRVLTLVAAILSGSAAPAGQPQGQLLPAGHSWADPSGSQFPSSGTPVLTTLPDPKATSGLPPDASVSTIGYKMTPPKEAVEPVNYPNARLTGFFQADIGWIHQTPRNVAAVGDAQDGADFRRARLQAVGDVAENVGYSVEFDFAFLGRPTFMDVWLELRELYGGARLRIGQFREPIGLDGLTSVKELTFLERGLPFVFLPFRQIGGMLHGTAADESATWAASVFRFPTDFYGSNIGDNGGYGFAGRLTRLVIDEGENLQLHFGGAYSFADPSQNAIRYFSPPEFFLAETGNSALAPPALPSITPPFVDTGAIAANNVNLFGAELAARSGSLHMQSEWLVSMVNQIGGDVAVFPGAYAQVGYILTGETRPYNRQTGTLGRIVPDCPVTRCGGCGAWEVAARWSYLDLNDAGITGGSLNDVTLGLNWYVNQYTKFQFNYIHAMPDTPVNGRSTADIVAARAQLDF